MIVTSSVQSRAAARHWVVGCISVIGVIVILLGIGGYLLYTKFKQHVQMGNFDVTSKIDPPASAPVDSLLPETAGSFKRTHVTTETAHVAMGSPFPGFPGSNEQITSGMVIGLYGDNDGHGAIVMAFNTAEARKQRQSASGPFAKMNRGEPGNSGFHMRMDLGAQPMDMAVWAKQNWTYMVQTTSTAALDFAKSFEPSK